MPQERKYWTDAERQAAYRERKRQAEEASYRERNQQAMPPFVRELVEAGFRSLTHKHHPDKGGSNEAMREILEAREWLYRLLDD